MRTRRRIERFIRDDLLPDVKVEGDPLADGMLDSLAIEQLIGFIEDEFQLTFGEDELGVEDFADVDAVVRLVEAKRRSGRSLG